MFVRHSALLCGDMFLVLLVFESFAGVAGRDCEEVSGRYLSSHGQEFTVVLAVSVAELALVSPPETN